jgi:myo-inositol 2-dehydrogenase / D-chiro-inositol 1-dehydrogenase
VEQLNVGIVGLGRIGQLHATNISHIRQFNLIACSDPFVTEFNHLKIHKECEALFNDDRIDAVLICSPSSLHSQHVLMAASNKKHIFCEKPIALNEPDIIEIMSVCEKNKVKLQVGFNRRFDKHFSLLKEKVNDCDDYLPHLIKITSRDPYPPNAEYLKQSGGIFFDMMIHDFDMLRFLSNDEVVEIYAKAWDQGEDLYESANDYAMALVQLKLKNGTLAVIENSRQSNYGYDQRIEVFSNQASFNVGNEPAHLVTTIDKNGMRKANPKEFFLARYDYAFKQQLLAFFDAIVNEKAPQVGAFDGLQAFKLAKNALQSVQSNKVIAC